MNLFEEILKARGLTGKTKDAFLNPSYDDKHDPFLLPDMAKAVERLERAYKAQEKITIYGDYDIDGLTATTLLLDALESFGFEHVDAFMPNRFVEGYGLTVDAIERIAKEGAKVIVTVDCGSLSHKEIVRANELGVDVIVTDHHNVADVQPPAVAVINPKRLLADYPEEYNNYVLKETSKMTGKIYPFLDLAGVGVAFKLVQALQTKLVGLKPGQEKWLLDLVALGTVCDVVNLTNENRANVYWGLKVLQKTRRPGLRALMAVSRITPGKVDTRSLGFGLGPRMNAAGRLETAQHSLDLLRSKNPTEALEIAEKLDVMNTTRRNQQATIVAEAKLQAEQYSSDSVLVLSGKNWSHGIVGIVASKIMETYKKPTYVLEEMEGEAKGSARSFGDFSVADAINDAGEVVTKGGGHKYAAGLTLPLTNIGAFRKRVNDYYRTNKLFNQENLLLPQEDVVTSFDEVTEDLVKKIAHLEPFGNGNKEPILKSENIVVIRERRMGSESRHLKLELEDSTGTSLQLLAFSAPKNFYMQPGERVSVWYHPTINEWNGVRSIEGRLLNIEVSE
jgi:single-stranded-DNA-specific exonuclease